MVPMLLVCCILALIIVVRAGDGGQVRVDDFTEKDPQRVMEILVAGNERFVVGEPRIIDDIQGLRERLARDGQEPIATVIACSDSRIPVEDIFAQPLGRLFVISTAGNAADLATRGTVRYGVEHLHTPVVVVMGHSHCGAIKAVVNRSEESGALGEMLQTIATVRDELGDIRDDEAAERTLAVANVRTVVETLLAQDDFLRKKVEKGEVRLVPAMYDIMSGRVEWLEGGPAGKK